jgi:hypothetical protein
MDEENSLRTYLPSNQSKTNSASNMEHDNNDHGHSSGRPRQPDKYFGQRDFLLLGNWLVLVDQYFILTDMPAHKQASYVSTLLHAEALL